VIGLVLENTLARIAPAHDMVNGTRELDSQRPPHPSNLKPREGCVNPKPGLTPSIPPSTNPFQIVPSYSGKRRCSSSNRTGCSICGWPRISTGRRLRASTRNAGSHKACPCARALSGPGIRIISRRQGPAWYIKENEHAASLRPWQDRGRSRDAGDHCARWGCHAAHFARFAGETIPLGLGEHLQTLFPGS